MVIQVSGLCKQYGEIRALQDISLDVASPAVIGLLGPNGAGKTTFVEILEGLRRPTSGRVTVLGLDPAAHPRALRERIGVQLQANALPRELTPLETLRLFGAFFTRSQRRPVGNQAHTPPGQRASPPSRSALELLDRVGIADHARARNYTLSGGQQRRLSLALALVNDPEVVLLDEPTSGLDPEARQQVHALLAELRAAGRTVLWSTHSTEEAEELCDRVILLRSGRVVADGAPLELVGHATGQTQFWIQVAGDLDPAPLERAGAVVLGNEGNYLRLAASSAPPVIIALGELAHRGQIELVDLRMKRPGLEDVYLGLMRDAVEGAP